MKVLVLTTLAVTVAATQNFYRLPTPYSYNCRESRCIKTDRTQVTEYRSLETCQLTCGKYGSLWPQPTGDVQLSSETVRFVPRNLRVTKRATSSPKVQGMLEEAERMFRRNIHYVHPEYPQEYKKPLTSDRPVRISEAEHRFRVQQQREQVQQVGQQEQQLNHQQQQQHNQQQNHQQVQIDNESYRNYDMSEEFVRVSPFLREHSRSSQVENQKVDVEVTVTSPDDKLHLDTDESYNMVVQTVDDTTTVTILATTYYGARHAFESLSQLISYDEDHSSLQIVRDVKINDAPKFKFRGLMLDTGRNFYPKEDLMRMLDAMSQNKMNYFHWHITDSASFPMYSNRRPEMAYYGAYSPRKIYYPEDITQIVQYAKLRGIQVIPELDAPAHAAAGWSWGEKEGKGKLVLCTEKGQPWFEVGKEPPSGQLNPVNPELYPILGELYKDMIEFFDPDMIHMGGDDVSFRCWQNANEIKEYLAANNREANSREYFELWNTFQSNAYAKLNEAAGQGRKITPIIHSSSFAVNYLDKDAYVIQLNEFANDTSIADYVNKGFKIIFSNQDQWRLDCSANSWLGDKAESCARELPTWEHFYKNSPMDMLFNMGVSNARSGQSQTGVETSTLVLGGEATLWSSDTDGNGFQQKAWPRVSALAERLWTDPILPVQGIDTAQKRINTHRQRMVQYGVRADPIQPEYCMQDEGACYNKEYFHAKAATHQQQQATPAQ
ncbi:hypothetical protein Pcinc_030216 [Petrolisthes cinctipes]|uniref:beta-N-acetylhexosaminidase n=2 Tax=Petrolisthes cinctipes TaxID=88211 RepID=A0AAE1EYU5_PETCI|nr:hypothetical protein Pcinc_030216 [Petrolisthes cinctipes]